jgi:hypothetical protein
VKEEEQQMRKLLLAGLVALFVPTASYAQVQLGLRAGYAPALGDAYKNMKLSDAIKSQVPVQLDASYKFDKDSAAGLYFSYGFGQLPSGTCLGIEVPCSASAKDLSLGVQGIHTFNEVGGSFLPWVGAGLGWERAYWSNSQGYLKASETLSGFEVILQMGGDYKLAEEFSIGPYVTCSVGQYMSARLNVSGSPFWVPGTTNLPIERTVHAWLSFGVLGKWDI